MLPKRTGQSIYQGAVFRTITVKHNTGDAQVESEESHADNIYSGTHSGGRGSWTPNDVHTFNWK